MVSRFFPTCSPCLIHVLMNAGYQAEGLRGFATKFLAHSGPAAHGPLADCPPLVAK